jgi:hypothetical protein
MLKKEMNEMFDKMSYEQQKEAMRLLEDNQSYNTQSYDNQSYDDSCNIVEIVVEAVFACIKVIAKQLF